MRCGTRWRAERAGGAGDPCKGYNCRIPKHCAPTATDVNPYLSKLHPYPFEQLRQLFSGVTPNPAYSPISLGIGEPKHPTPAFIEKALTHAMAGLSSYPSTHGSEALRVAIAGWL